MPEWQIEIRIVEELAQHLDDRILAVASIYPEGI